MKILYLSTERGWHGGEEQLRLLAQGAREAGHDCRLVARHGGKFAERMSAAEFDVASLASNVRGLRSILRVRQAIRAWRPNVVHANDPHALTLLRWATWGLANRPVRIASRRVLFAPRSPGKYVRGSERIVCVSRAIAEVCRKAGIAESQLAVVHDGVDPGRMQRGDAARGRAALGVGAETPLALCVAQLAAYKGHRYLIDAWQKVIAVKPQAMLVLAGEGPLRTELEQQIASLGLSESVRMLGYRNDVPDLVQACDLCVLASPEEGLGTAVLDAMFAGRGVVGADAGGIPEMLRDANGNMCGWLAAARDPMALAAAIVDALDRPEERARRAMFASEWAASEFTAATMVKRTLEIYRALSRRARA